MPKPLDQFVLKKAKDKAKARGRRDLNYSEVLADLVVEARNRELEAKAA